MRKYDPVNNTTDSANINMYRKPLERVGILKYICVILTNNGKKLLFK